MNNRLFRAIYFAFVLFLVQNTAVLAQQTKVSKILNDFYKHPEYTLVVAHRGAHQKFAENSIAAIKEAIRLGVDIIELDVRETKDHQLVLMHDSTIDRTTTGKGKVEDLTLKELNKEKLLFDGEPTEETIPTLSQALEVIKDKIIIDIDFKADGNRALKKAYEIIQTKKIQEQVIFYIYDDWKRIKLAKKIDATVNIMPRVYEYKELENVLVNEKPNVVHVDWSFYNDKWAKKTLLQCRLWANALGKYDKLQIENKTGYPEIIKKHVNVIQTDYPKELLLFLKNNGLHR